MLLEPPGHHLHLGEAAPCQAAALDGLHRPLQILLKAGRFGIREPGCVLVHGPDGEQSRLPLVQGLAPAAAAVQKQFQHREGIDPGLRLPGGEFLDHPVPETPHFLQGGMFPQVQIEDGEDMRHQPHPFQLPQELEIRLAQAHPGADDIKHQVALHQVGQDLGQVLGNGGVAALAVPELQPRGRPGKGHGEKHVF